MKYIYKLLPNKIDNSYYGNKIAKYAIFPMLILILFRSSMHWLGVDGGAQSIAGLPLDTYSDSAQNNIIAIFSLWGFSQILMLLIYFPIIIKYQSLIPAFWMIQLIEWSGRWLTSFFKPMILPESPPGEIGNYVFTVFSIIMLFFALKDHNTKDAIQKV